MPKPGSGKSAPKPTASSGGKEKKERVIEALVPKPSDSFIDNSRDPRAAGQKSYYEAKSHNPLDKGRTSRKIKEAAGKVGETIGKAADTVTSFVTGDMTKDERASAASRTKAAEEYQKEQDALLAASKERMRKAAAGESDSGLRAGEAIPEDKAAARQAEWSRNWNDERLAATRAAREAREKAQEGLSADEQRDEQRAMREAAKPAETPATPFRSDKPADAQKPAGGWSSFMDDEDDEDGVDEETFFPTSDEPLPSEAASAQPSELDRIKSEYSDLQSLYNRIMWGKIGKDYSPEDIARLPEIEKQLRTYESEIKSLEEAIAKSERPEDYKPVWMEEAQAGAGGADALSALEQEYQEISNGLLNGTIPPDKVAEANARLTELSPQIAALQREASDADIALERAGDVVAGTGKGIASSVIGAASTGINLLADLYAQRGQSTDEYLVDLIRGDPNGSDRPSATPEEIDATLAQVYDVATQLGQSAQADLDHAKEGLTSLGKDGVDIAANLLQMGFDMGAAYLTGGSTLDVMGLRVFGQSALDAHNRGEDVFTSSAYGLGNAGVELFTEKMSGLLNVAYGHGVGDDVAEILTRELAQTDLGRTAIRMLLGAAGEGIEEGTSNFLSVIPESILDSDAIKTIFSRYKDPKVRAEALHEVFLGWAVGMIGNTTGLISGENANLNAEAREADAAEARVNEQMNGVMDALANPNAGLTAEEQRAEQNQQRQQTPDEVLAEAATPQAEEARQTSGEERAEGQAPEVTEKGEEEQPQPKKEEETPTKEQPKPEPRTPDEILADEATPKGERAESPSGAVESTQAEDHESVPESTQESTSEAPAELNNEPTATDYNEAQVEALEADFEADPVNVQRFQDGQGTYGQYSVQERLEVLQRLFPDSDYYISEGNIVKGRTYDTTTGQSEAFGDKRTGSNHAAPKRKTSPNSNIKGPSAQQNTFDPQTVKAGDKLTHNTWGDVTVVDVQNGRVTVEMPDGELKTVLQSSMGDKFTPVQGAQIGGTIDEKNQTGRSEHHTAARSVEEANRALKEIERFKQNPEYRGSSYSNAEDAQTAVDKTISDLRDAGLTNAEELRNQAQELRERSKEAQRMVDKIEASTPEGEDITDPDYNYWYDEVDAAENEAYALDEIADFIEANPDAFAKDLDVEQGGIESEQIVGGEDRSDSPVDSDAGTDAQDSRGERKDDSRRDGEMVGGESTKNLESQADYDAAKDKRDQVKRRFDRGQAFVESEIELDGGEVIDIKYAPGWIKRAVEKAQKEAPDCRFVIATKTAQIAYYSHGNGTIVLNPGRLQNWALSVTKKTGVPHSATNAVLHERVHYWFERSDYNASEILKYIQSDFAYDAEAQQALRDAYVAHKADYHADIASESASVEEMQNALWEEVIADLAADLPRAFVNDGKVNPAYDRIRTSATKYVQNYVVPSYRINNGIDLYNGKPATGGDTAPSNPDGGNDPGANKSWADSLMAQEAPPENTEVEQPGDDMTPLNDISREQDEERREKQKAETKKRLGTANHKRLSDSLDRLEKWKKEYNERYGEPSRDEHGGYIQDEDGNDIMTSVLDDLTKNLRATLEGEQTIQSFQEYYESLRAAEGESKATDENYLYDGPLAEALNQFANAERELIYAEKGGPANAEKAVLYGEGPSKEVAKENYDKQSEAFSLVFAKRMERLEDSFKERTKVNSEVTENSKDESAGLKNWLDRQSERFWQSQMRPDTFFKMLGGFYERGSKALYSLAQRSGDSLKTRITVRNNAMSKFNELTESKETKKAWKDIEQGKTKCSVKVPGIKGEVSMNTALGLLKTLMTNGSLDHIARFGAQFVNESDYYKGYNNNGMGETDGYRAQNRLTRDVLDQMARENLQAANEGSGGKSKITGKDIYDEKIRILKTLRSDLMSEVMSNPAAKAAYEASIDAMEYLADELNGTTLNVYGIAKALQGSNYWPMTVIGQGNNLQFINNTAFTMEDASFLQHRQGGSGALMIKPFAETMASYTDRASRFVGFGELNSDLMMMSKEIGVGHGEHDAEKQSIQSVIEKQAGKSAAEWMERYVKTLNGLNKNPGGLGAKIRGNLASSSLTLNPGVALKQSPSYLNAAGIIDLDILIKNRLVTAGALRTARSYENDPILAEINKRTGILESRKSGTVTIGEAGADGRALFGNLKRFLPPWITNRDVSTVSNLALACAEQVKRNNPGIDTKSEEFYQKTAELLEEATIKTQPIYDPEFRPDYLRSESEIVRMLSMFRTQQSQNLNQLMQAYGEMAAAKARGSEAEQKAATKKARQVTAGYVMSQAAFAVLSSAAKLLMHKRDDFEDEDGNLKFGKLAKRFGLDLFSNSAGVMWFGDTIAKAALDLTTNALTGGKGTSEFYKLSDNTISTVDSMISSAINLAKNPSAKTAKNAVFDISQGITGLPTRNAYNIVNSIIMYAQDVTGNNPTSEDDIINKLQNRSKQSESTRAKETTEAAVRALGKGDRKRANALLSTLDTTSSDVRTAIRKAAGDAYVAGDIDEMTYRGILRNYGGVEVAKIGDVVHDKDLDKVIAALTEKDPKLYEGVVSQIGEAKDHLKSGESSSNAAAKVILDAAMDKSGTDAFMEKYTSSGYFTAYEAMRKTYSPKFAVDMIAALDVNKDDKLAQDELYNYYLENSSSEGLIKTIWNANGFSKTWDQYKAGKKVEYDMVAAENNDTYQFGSAEKQLKDLQGDARLSMQKADADPAMFKVISGMKLSDKDTDTVVDRYVSSSNRANYHVLRDAGLKPSECFDMIIGIDENGKGTVSQKEMWAYYKAHPDQEKYIELLFNSQGYTSKGQPKTWKTFKKSQK